MAAHFQGGADIASQRPNVGPRRTVHCHVDVHGIARATDRKDVEPVDAKRAGGEFDGLPLAGQLVGALAADLDGADGRRDLLDVAAQRSDGPDDGLIGDVISRNRLQHFTFSVIGGGGPAQLYGRE